MKICLASLAPFVGGAEVAMERLATGLLRNGHEVVLALGNNGEAATRFRKAGLRCVHLSMPFTDKWTWPRYWWRRTQFCSFLSEERVEILHCNDLPSFQLPGDAAGRLGITKICHHRYVFEGPAISWFTKPGADCHIFVSHALRNDLQTAWPALQGEPCEVVHDGLEIPEEVGASARNNFRMKMSLPAEKTIVLFAGQIIPRKGVQDLLRGWSLLSEQVQTVAQLTIIGDDLAGQGAYLNEMRQLADKLNIAADFRGFQKDVNPWLSVAEVVVVPSHVEPLGNATLEAMAHGCPVIGCSVGGIPEMIVERQTGLLVPPQSPESLAEALKELIVDRHLRETMGRNARQRSKECFSLEAHVRSIENIYRRFALPKS